MGDLFAGTRRFQGLPVDGFSLFDLPDRAVRRRAIVQRVHPALAALGDDLTAALASRGAGGLHAHLPRLDWPRGYEPFCTWLALSSLPAGYQAGPQLNVGVHRDFVAVRLGWDTSVDGFGRFEFLARFGGIGSELAALAGDGLRFRVYESAPWPDGARLTFDSAGDAAGSFRAAARSGNWWELGRRWELPGARGLVTSPEFGEHVERVVLALLPVFARASGGVHAAGDQRRSA